MPNPISYRSILPVFLILCACSDSPKTAETKAPPKVPEALTGRQAFQRTYPQARGWALDAQPLRVRSVRLEQVKADKGKSGAWEVAYVSASKGKARNYTYSAVEAEGNLHEGVFAGLEEGYSGSRGPAFPFEVAAIKTDSDQAFDAAAEKSQDYIKKHPDMPVTFLLEKTNRFPDLTWRVIWGESASSSDYSVFVDASTGKYIEKAH